MTEYKLVPVAGGEEVNLTIPAIFLAFNDTNAPELTKHPVRCQGLLDALSEHGICRASDGSMIIDKKAFPDIRFDEIVYYLVDGGKRRDPNGLKTVLEAIKFFGISKTYLAKKFHRHLKPI